MVTRFVYPKKDEFFQKRGFTKEATQLLITSTTDDGKCWFGIEDGIKNYLEETGIEITNVLWKIKVKPKNEGYAPITATSVEDFVKQFNALPIVYDLIKEEKW
jgi:hypothetical protein